MTPTGTPTRLAAAFALGLALSALGCGGADDVQKCTADIDCFNGYACDLALTEQCLRRCESNAQCLSSQTCDIPATAASGVCRMLPP